MSNQITLAKKSFDDLLVLRAEIDKEIAAKATAEVAELEKRIESLKAIAATHAPTKAGKTVRSATKPRKTVRKPKTPKLTLVESQTSEKTSKAKAKKRKPIGKAPIKFRDPKTGNTWSGRGRTPIWLRAHEEAGRNRQKYAVAS
ncbi:MAG: H-NS histone family protein [Pseudomonadota bacterium]